MKLSANESKILEAMLNRPGTEFYGLEVSRLTGISRNGIYTTLGRMKQKGLLDLRKADQPVGPPVVYYWVTGTGQRAYHAAGMRGMEASHG